MQLTNPFADPDFAEFQKKSGKASKTLRINGIFVYKYPLTKRLSIFYTYDYPKDLNRFAKAENIVYTLIESYKPVRKKSAASVKQLIPRNTLVIDLKKSEEDILKSMHQKGRYNIKTAERKGVKIKEENNPENFYKLLQKTAARNGFSINPENFYRKMISVLGPEKCKLFTAYKDSSPVASIIVTFIGNTATYFYGANSYKHRNLMAPYLLQWHAIREAKKRELEYYDFLGIADPGNKKDSLKGVTEFKRKFGGSRIKWPDSITIVHKPIVYLMIRLRRMFV